LCNAWLPHLGVEQAGGDYLEKKTASWHGLILWYSITAKETIAEARAKGQRHCAFCRCDCDKFRIWLNLRSAGLAFMPRISFFDVVLVKYRRVYNLKD
jgi:hypothetical protein